VLLENENDMDEDGKPWDKKYLEAELPENMKHFLDEFIQRQKNHVSHMDCLCQKLYDSCLPVGRSNHKRTGKLPVGKISVWGGCRGR